MKCWSHAHVISGQHKYVWMSSFSRNSHPSSDSSIYFIFFFKTSSKTWNLGIGNTISIFSYSLYLSMLTGHATSADDPEASPGLIHASGGHLHSMKSQEFLWICNSWVWDGEFDLKWASAQLQQQLVSKLCKTQGFFAWYSWTWIRYLLPAWVLTNLRDILGLGPIHFCRGWFSLKFFCNQIRAPLSVHTCRSPADRLSVLCNIKLVLAFHSVH